jgi:hypothetical protein
LTLRTNHHAARHNHPGHWTWDDVAAALGEANATARPRGPYGPTPQELWDSRTAITPDQNSRRCSPARDWPTATAPNCERRSVRHRRIGILLLHRPGTGLQSRLGPANLAATSHPSCSRRTGLSFCLEEANSPTHSHAKNGNHYVGSTPYIPMNPDGTPVPLARHPGAADMPLPDPTAQGSHTVLGGRVGTTDGVLYRQSATFYYEGFEHGTFNGQRVPALEVDWYNHARPWDHSNPHYHQWSWNGQTWVRGPQRVFDVSNG